MSVLVILGTILMFSYITFYQGLKVGNVSLVGTISASFTAVVVILSVIFLGEKITLFQIFSILLIFLGVILASFEIKSLNKSNLFKDPGIKWAIATMVLWGIYYTFIKIPVQSLSWFWPEYLTFLMVPVIWFFMKWKKIKIEKPRGNKSFVPLILVAFFTSSATFSYNYAISNYQVAVVAPTAGAYPTLFVLLAFILFRDKITRQQILGIITTLSGIVLLSTVSS